MGWPFVIAGYLAVYVGLGLYAAVLIRRARHLAAQLPEEKRHFLD